MYAKTIYLASALAVHIAPTLSEIGLRVGVYIAPTLAERGTLRGQVRTLACERGPESQPLSTECSESAADGLHEQTPRKRLDFEPKSGSIDPLTRAASGIRSKKVHDQHPLVCTFEDRL